jgi:tRNA G18 (ribose-2'-O)-methylase SpoU
MTRANLIRISDLDDPRVGAFRDIRERDLTGREGRFIAEGTVVLRMLATVHGGTTGIEAETVLLLENRLDGVRDIIDALPESVPVMIATRPVMDAIAGFPIHRGILALGRRPAPASVGERIAMLPSNALVLVASGIANHDNIGGLFRNAAAFGADAVLIDALCCDPLYRKAIRVSVGAALKVPFAQGGDLAEILDSLDRAGFAIWGLSPSGTVPIARVPAANRVALVVGTEGEGLPASVLSRLQTARIPQAPGFDSLNVATAAGIALHAMATTMGRL